MRRSHEAILAASLAIGIMAVIFASSNQTYQEQSILPIFHRLPWLEKWILSWRFCEDWQFYYAGKVVSFRGVDKLAGLEFLLRKFAHFTLFALLAYSWYKTFYFGASWKWLMRFMLTLLICISYAGFDEFHQMLTGGRTPLLEDVLLDSIGAFSGTLLALYRHH
ncbi:VanZ family protein [Atopobacter sp. AH10]|uniref:VanZ family protein n=1 Tax=Atopobacter sp. AH10 TaxID=2315861 RepID=UPI000EF28AAB|nr:VanZ family protein [Atopobacter sp. AH10]RLK63974.1 VanZ family protein [Atopobacter sp. AH10]